MSWCGLAVATGFHDQNYLLHDLLEMTAELRILDLLDSKKNLQEKSMTRDIRNKDRTPRNNSQDERDT